MALRVSDIRKRGRALLGGPSSILDTLSAADRLALRNELLDTHTVPPVVDEINRHYPFNTNGGIGSSLSLGGWSGAQMLHTNASVYPWVVEPIRFPEHWQTAGVDAFWVPSVAGITGGPTLQVAKIDADPEGGGLTTAPFTASANVAEASELRTQYEEYQTTLNETLVVDPTKLTRIRVLRVSLNASPDGYLGPIALTQIRLRRTS